MSFCTAYGLLLTQSGHGPPNLISLQNWRRPKPLGGWSRAPARFHQSYYCLDSRLAIAAHAQQPTKPVIGFLSSRSPDESKHELAAFHKGLSEAGFIEGTNIVVEYRWATGEYEKLPALAADLVRRRVTVIVAVGGEVSARAAEQATTTIPIVFGAAGDVVRAGLVKSLGKPEGNATGFTLLTSDLEPKRLGLLHDLLPKADVVGVLYDPN